MSKKKKKKEKKGKWLEFGRTGETPVSLNQFDFSKATPIEMPIRGPSDIESHLKPTTEERVFRETEGYSSEPMTFVDSEGSLGAQTQIVDDMRVLPYSAVGKLVAHYPPNMLGYGSAFVIGWRTFFTAAHCVDGNPSEIIFCPQYQANGVGMKRWRSHFAYIHGGYFNEPHGDLRYDFAVCITDPDDEPIMPYTGNLGWLTVPPNLPQGLSIGYPENPPREFNFNGQIMWQSEGAFRAPIHSPQDIISMENEMTKGCSGGPIVVNMGFVGGWRAVGLNSHVHSWSERRMCSPIFDEDFERMILEVRKKEKIINSGLSPEDPNYKRLL